MVINLLPVDAARKCPLFFLAIMAQYSIIARMINRRIYTELLGAIDDNPAVALLGPRQVGKTTLALEVRSSRPSLYAPVLPFIWISNLYPTGPSSLIPSAILLSTRMNWSSSMRYTVLLNYFRAYAD